MTACTKQPLEPIVPYVKQPEELVPGRPMFYATAFTLGGYASPVLVESHMFRPTKIEGNADHPASQGGTDVYAQASLLDMYDPDRSQNVIYMGDISTWSAFDDRAARPAECAESIDGRGYSHSFADVFIAHARRPDARLLRTLIRRPSGISRSRSIATMFMEGAQMAFGQPVETTLRLVEGRCDRLARC